MMLKVRIARSKPLPRKSNILPSYLCPPASSCTAFTHLKEFVDIKSMKIEHASGGYLATRMGGS